MLYIFVAESSDKSLLCFKICKVSHYYIYKLAGYFFAWFLDRTHEFIIYIVVNFRYK